MNKTCARCQKVVYPIEELKCLDKTWHKTCFRCTECGMTLNMKTYKGYNKSPYCEAHIPKAKATAIADTPELKRIAENTKHQSNVKYHADFEKAKGKFTQVADDPETLRIKQNTKHISNVAYHGDLEKKAAMEKQREAAEVADSREESEYFSETLAAEQLSQYAPQAQSPLPQQISPPLPVQQHPTHSQQQYQPQQHQHHHQPQQQQQQQQQHTLPPPPIQHHQHNTAAIIPSSQAPTTQNYNQQNHRQQQPQQHQQQLPPQQQQYQHYQQPQALQQQRQQQQQQLQQQQQQSPIKQTSHLYPTGSNHQQSQQQQQHESQSQSQYQQPTGNIFSQLRSAILQNSHHPTGAVQPGSEGVAATSPSYAYDQYDNYAPRPAVTTAAPVVYNNNNNNNNNNGSSYQSAQQQLSQSKSAQQQLAQQQSAQQQLAAKSFSPHAATHQVYNSNSYNPSHQSSSSSVNYTHGGSGGHATTSTAPSSNTHTNGVLLNNGSASASNNIGKIADYDPLTDGPRPMPNTTRPTTTLIYSSDSRGSANNAYPKRIGSVADIDPANGIYGSLVVENNMSAHQQQQQLHQQQHQQPPQSLDQQQQQYYQQMQMLHQQQQIQMAQKHEQQMRHQQQMQQQLIQQQQQQQQQQKQSLRVYRALYDYEAQDTDEVSFREGDVIFEVDSIDSGWMTGRVERTGKTGMLPANYVEKAVI